MRFIAHHRFEKAIVFFSAGHLLKVELTKVSTFHSHLEGLWRLTEKKLADHVGET